MRLQPLRVVAAGAACLVAGCGSPSSSPSQLSAAAADRMNEAVVATRAAADARDREKAMRALGALSEIVSRESRAGRLSAADERALRTAITQARGRVELDVEAPVSPPPPPPPPPPQATPVPQSPPDEKEEQPEQREDEEDKVEKPDKPGKRKGDGKGRD